jgi:phosphate transport system permease protein
MNLRRHRGAKHLLQERYNGPIEAGARPKSRQDDVVESEKAGSVGPEGGAGGYAAGASDPRREFPRLIVPSRAGGAPSGPNATTGPGAARHRPRFRFRELLFQWTLRFLAVLIPLLLIAIGFDLYHSSQLSRTAFGWQFLWTSEWDPVFDHFGAWPYLYGTLLTTAVALTLATPLGVGVAIFLAELAPRAISEPLAVLTSLLAAIPSVVYGLWGIFVLAPLLQAHVEPWLGQHLAFLPLFRGAPYGVGYLAAGIILAIMILPYIISVSRDVMHSIPRTQRDAAYALAGTQWEAIWHVVLPSARGGIFGGVLLGMGRALGETMAVTMVIGNTPTVSSSLFAPGYSLASVIANEFSEATTPLYISALFEVGLVLFAISLAANLFARLLVWRVRGTGPVGEL